MTHPLEDADLVRAAQRGDLIAMSSLLDALLPHVARICGAIALDDGPDAAQETLIQVFRDLGSLANPAALRGWARRIATREAVRHARKATREAPLLAPDALRGLPTIEVGTDVVRVLRALAPEQRAILLLRDLEGLSEREAAEQLGVALGTAKSRLHRARAAFAERWEERNDEPE